MKISETNEGERNNIHYVLKILADISFSNAVNHGFYEGQNIPEGTVNLAERISLEHSELSERLEAIRKPGADQHCPEFTNEEIECADTLIRLMDYVEMRRIATDGKFDFSGALIAKMLFNEMRPYKHNKEF